MIYEICVKMQYCIITSERTKKGTYTHVNVTTHWQTLFKLNTREPSMKFLENYIKGNNEYIWYKFCKQQNFVKEFVESIKYYFLIVHAFYDEFLLIVQFSHNKPSTVKSYINLIYVYEICVKMQYCIITLECTKKRTYTLVNVPTHRQTLLKLYTRTIHENFGKLYKRQ